MMNGRSAGTTMMNERPELSFLMPCLNEAGTVGTCVWVCGQAIEALGISAEIVVADNGSTDRSDKVAEEAGARLVRVAEKGYGSALRTGIAAARGQYVLFADSDATYDFSCAGQFLERLRRGADLVVGCRFPKGGGEIEEGAMPWSHRWIGNPALSMLGRMLFACDLSDFHCGIRGFNRERIEPLDLRCPGMEFATEMIVRAALAGYRLEEVPVRLSPGAPGRLAHLRSIRDGLRHMRLMGELWWSGGQRMPNSKQVRTADETNRE